MAGNYKRRKRKIDLNKLNTAQADALAKQLGQEIARIMDEANNKCNKILQIYNLQTKIGYEIVQLVENTKKNKKNTKKNNVSKTI